MVQFAEKIFSTRQGVVSVDQLLNYLIVILMTTGVIFGGKAEADSDGFFELADAFAGD